MIIVLLLGVIAITEGINLYDDISKSNVELRYQQEINNFVKANYDAVKMAEKAYGKMMASATTTVYHQMYLEAQLTNSYLKLMLAQNNKLLELISKKN